MTTLPLTAAPAAGMTPAKIAILVGYGVVLWAIGVVLLRLVASAAWFGSPLHPLLYVLIIPGTWPCIRYGPAVAGLPRRETLRAATIASMTALLIDGIIIGFVPDLYASDPATARACAGALLWGVGVALILGLIMQPRGD